MFKIAKDFELPLDYVTWKAANIGRTGSGKTNTAVVIAEQMIRQGHPIAILDPQGDWWGLRTKFKIAILGGEHGDIPLDPGAGEQAADFVINERVPVLLDLFTMGEAEMVRFGTDFARRLWHKNRAALHVFLDEADLFAPQSNVKGPKAACLGAWQNIVRRGRSRGIGCTMLTQRSAVINKDLLTQADPLFVHRLTAPQDLASVRDYLDAHGIAKETAREIIADITKLPLGACWLISPGSLGIEPRRLQIAYRTSYDSSAAPAPGQAAAKAKEFASIDLGVLTKQFAATVERAKADDPKELRKRIAELEQAVRKAQAAAASPLAGDDPVVLQAVAAAEQRWKQSWANCNHQMRDYYNAAAGLVEKAIDSLNAIRDLPFPDQIMLFRDIPPKPLEQRAAPRAEPVKVARAPAPPREPQAAGDGTLSKMQRAFLTVLAQHREGLTKQVLLIHAGYAGGGKPSACFAQMSADGWVEAPVPGSLKITAAGLKVLGPYKPLPIGDALRAELLDEHRSRLAPIERKLLSAICDAYPEALAKNAILEAAGYAGGGKPSAAFAKLRRIGYVTAPTPGSLQAADILFS